MSENAVGKPMTFEERVREKLRKEIGELLTVEELDRIVTKSMDELFFQPRKNPRFTQYTYRSDAERSGFPEFLPPLAHELCLKSMEPLIKAAIEKWVAENEEQIRVTMKTTFEDELPKAMLSAVHRMFVDLSMPSMMKLREVCAKVGVS